MLFRSSVHDIAYGQRVHEYTIDAGIGTHTITTDDGNRTNILDIEGNSTEVFVQGEYFFTKHDAVTGGLFYREKEAQLQKSVDRCQPTTQRFWLP